MKKKTVRFPVYKMGKHCGYHENKDGSIIVAPTYSDQFDSISSRKCALDILLKSVTEQCHKLLIPLMEEQKELWDRMTEDYPLDGKKYEHSYTYGTNTITRKEKKEESADEN